MLPSTDWVSITGKLDGTSAWSWKRTMLKNKTIEIQIPSSICRRLNIFWFPLVFISITFFKYLFTEMAGILFASFDVHTKNFITSIMQLQKDITILVIENNNDWVQTLYIYVYTIMISIIVPYQSKVVLPYCTQQTDIAVFRCFSECQLNYVNWCCFCGMSLRILYIYLSPWHF